MKTGVAGDGRRHLAFYRFAIVWHAGSMPPKPTTPIGAPPAQPAQLLIDLQAMEAFEVGAGLVTLLVCPAPHEHEQRREVFLGICASFAAEQTRSVPAEADYMRTVRPQYFAVEPKVYRAVHRQVKTALKSRMRAALIARPFIGQAKLGANYSLPKEVGTLTLTNVAEFIAAEHKLGSGDNLMSRAWRPSRPVLHLAVGLEHAFNHRAPIEIPTADPDRQIVPVDVVIDYQDIDLFRLAVTFGAEAAEIIRDDPRMKIAEHELAQIEWVE